MTGESGGERAAAARLAVRLARAEDLGPAAALFDAYRQFYGAISDVSASRRFLAARRERDESVLLLAVVDAPQAASGEQAVGLAQLYRSFSSVSLGATMILNDLFVAPEWRRFGIAGRLVDQATDYARRTGAIRLELATQQTNHAGLALYRSRGFVAATEFSYLSLALDSEVG